MKIGDSIKQHLTEVLRNTVFKERTSAYVGAVVSSNIQDSVFPIAPKADKVTLEGMDATHDKLTLSYEDYEVSGVVTWRIGKGMPNMSTKHNAYVFVSYE